MSSFEFCFRFLVQVVVVLGACRLAGAIAVRLGQPRVVAEMIGGVVLGPSVFGVIAPEIQAAVFPAEVRTPLRVLGQIGVVLYMFLVGVEFRTDLFRDRARDAVAVSLAGIGVPFALGSALAVAFLGIPGFFPDGVGRGSAMLFLGASMSITAFPVLARIVEERGLAGTPLGTLALAAGAIDDVIAWCLLAVVMAGFRGDTAIAALAIGGGALYVAVMLSVGRRLLRLLGRHAERRGRLEPSVLALVLAAVWVCGAITEWIGIHAVFGAFVLGVAMPRGVLATGLTRLLTPAIVAVLLPLFFTFSGLNTRLDLVDGPFLWLIAAVVLACASIGKAGACWAAARWAGADPATARAIGILMNTRGMMELIILNIGLQAGLIAPALFSIMVMMAILTTLATTPVFERVYGRAARAAGTLAPPGVAS